MKLTTVLTAMVGLGLVTTTPIATAPESPKAFVGFDPMDAYKSHPKMREHQTTKRTARGKTSWVNVEGVPLMEMEGSKKMRVFHDGSYADGWSRPPEKKIQPGERPRALLFWEPADAYRAQAKRKLDWEQVCEEAVTRDGCGVAVMHHGQRHVIKADGLKMHYINVEAAPITDMEKVKKMRVFRDGSSVEGWAPRARKDIVGAKGKKNRAAANRLNKTPPPDVQPALVSWDPAGSYEKWPTKRFDWEHRCALALARAGCGAGIIHQGESKMVRNGQKMPYLKVEGALSKGKEYEKKLVVFQDGSYDHGWSRRDRLSLKRSKREGKALPAPESRKAVISWDPPGTYKKYKRRRLHWERLCDEALVREYCGAGIIHQGETSFTKPNGVTKSYVRVEGAPVWAPATGTGYEKKLRVFNDGSSENGWDDRDRRLIAKAKAARGPDRRPGQPGRRRLKTVRPSSEGSTTTQDTTHSSMPQSKRPLLPSKESTSIEDATESSMPSAKRPRGPDRREEAEVVVNPETQARSQEARSDHPEAALG